MSSSLPLQAAVEAYPHTWEVDTTLATLIAKYSDLEDGARIDEASCEPSWTGAHTLDSIYPIETCQVG